MLCCSLTAPNGPAQQVVIRASLTAAGLSPGDVGALELHGTGTPLGDPIEIGAISAVLLKAASDRNPLQLAAGKTCVGHTEPAAGIVGLVSSLHAAAQEELPPILHLTQVSQCFLDAMFF